MYARYLSLWLMITHSRQLSPLTAVLVYRYITLLPHKNTGGRTCPLPGGGWISRPDFLRAQEGARAPDDVCVFFTLNRSCYPSTSVYEYGGFWNTRCLVETFPLLINMCILYTASLIARRLPVLLSSHRRSHVLIICFTSPWILQLHLLSCSYTEGISCVRPY